MLRNTVRRLTYADALSIAKSSQSTTTKHINAPLKTEEEIEKV